ncbi:MAG: hypothetical protein AABX44_01800 [Nanoarchaeota archaeon]
MGVLGIRELAEISCEISSSKYFELDDLGCIVLKETNTRVEYPGDNTIELINPKNLFSIIIN